MEVIRSNKGGEKLCYDGHMYTKKSSSVSTKRWECSKRAALSCNGNVTTDIDVSHVISSVDHNHERNGFAVEATKMRENLRQRAIGNRSNTSQILADAIEQLTEGGRVAMGNTNSVKRNILRQLQANRPKEPASLQELRVENEWTTTGVQDQLPFLIHDSGVDARNRIVAFATEDGLRHLAGSDTWFMDGTFSSAPALL
ncbi:Uncharacterised protein g7146 [Pycnogonum litorale]